MNLPRQIDGVGRVGSLHTTAHARTPGMRGREAVSYGWPGGTRRARMRGVIGKAGAGAKWHDAPITDGCLATSVGQITESVYDNRGGEGW